MLENLGPNEGRTFSLILESSEEYNCENYKIDYKITNYNSITNIAINEITEPADCAEGIAPAVAALNFANLDNGFHLYRINLKNSIINDATLQVTDSKYTFKFENANGIDISNSTLNKMPPLTIWGIIDYENNMSDKSTAFLNGLLEIAHEDDFAKGNYGYFSIEEDDAITINNVTTEFENLTPFLFKYNGDETTLQALVEAINQLEDISIQLFTSTGEEF